MKRTIIVFDFETTHKDPRSEYCDIVEIGAVAIHSKTLKTIKGSEFYLDVRPPDIDKPDFYENRKDTINWHVALQPNRTVDSMIEKWKAGTPEKDAIKMFIDYCNHYKWGKSWDTSPIAGGTNITDYDIPILERLVEKYGFKYPFFKRDKYEIQQLCLYTLGYSPDQPRAYNMDNLRSFFGLATENCHQALYDAIQEAQIIELLGGELRSLSKNFQGRGMLEKIDVS